jgi:hypothetical protein
MTAVGAEEEILTPGHRFELVAFKAIGTSFGLHGPRGLKSPTLSQQNIGASVISEVQVFFPISEKSPSKNPLQVRKFFSYF